MKKITLILSTALTFYTANSQVLYDENFDNLTLGNLGTDPSGLVPGQSGWLTDCFTCPQNAKDNTRFIISAETNRGKVLNILSPSPIPHYVTSLLIKKQDLNLLIDQRTAGRNVIKWEFDYYTGPQYDDTNQGYNIGLTNDIKPSNNFNSLASFIYKPSSGNIVAFYHDGLQRQGVLLNGNNDAKLPFNSWIKFIIYLDYNNNKIYFETPYFNKIVKADFLSLSTSPNLMQDFKPTAMSFIMRTSINSAVQNITKYDNIKLTALQAVPPHVLSADVFLSEKFNIYPNPATNIVTITNNENMLINQVIVYDIAGKQLSSKSFNNEAEVQLNVEHLASGTYMLHIQTNEGTAVKKLVKN